jgi:sulfoquinovosidase
MRRREFLVAGAGGVAAALASSPRVAESSTPSTVQIHKIGDFELVRTRTGVAVRHQSQPERLLWEAEEGELLEVEQATASIRAFGRPEGAYDIRDKVEAAFGGATIGSISVAGAIATLRGELTGKKGKLGYRITFEALSTAHLRFEVAAIGAGAETINRIRLRSASVKEEGFFGFGQQLTVFNQKGALIPILVQEHGVGRGQPIVTQLVDIFADHGGGNPHITEAPAPHFISSRLRSLFLENTEYSTFDMRPAAHYEIKVWSGRMTGQILFGATPLDLIAAYTSYAGRMRALPDWTQNGVIVSVQGGTKKVREKLEKIRAADIPLAGLWIQDWPGKRVTSAGTQLWWDWRLDEAFYPEWKELVADLKSRGARMMLYVNPFLSNAAGHDRLFNEGREKGYLVQKHDGSPYLIRNTDFYAGLVDLHNPDARTWIKKVIKDELIAKAGASGWMADFAEAMPFDAKLSDGMDPMTWHNRYTEEWARVNREAIEEAGLSDEGVCFHRSAFTRSPKYATLFWLGDQMQSWDQYDGIKTAVVGTLSGGISGFSLVHFDIGGYVSLSLKVAGKKIPIIARNDELFQRWMELGAFTAVYRTHEGLDPDVSAQFDSDPANTQHLKRFASIFKALAPYRKRAIAEAAARGAPVVRHPFLHFPTDPNVHSLRYQFLLGADVMVAPVLDKGATSVEVYFPQSAEWIDMWTGEDAGTPGHWMRMPAPLAQPAVFLRKGTASVDEIRNNLKLAGIV